MAYRVLCFRISHRAAVKVLTWTVVSSKGLTREESTPLLTHVIIRISSLKIVGLRASFPHYKLARN